jgi:histidine decarboxylase
MKDEDIPFGPTQQPWVTQCPDYAKALVSPPTADPVKVYRQRNYEFEQTENAINSATVELPPGGQNEAEQSHVYEQLKSYVQTQQDSFLGYQTEETIHYQTQLAPFLDVSLNNVGDPFVNGNYTLNTKPLERSVLDYFASLWNAKWPSQGPYVDQYNQYQKGDPESYWGYVLTMGSTEGNLYAMLNARDYLSGVMLLEEEIRKQDDKGNDIYETSLYAHYPNTPDRNVNAYTPVAFFSEDTHYSIVKAMAVEKIETFGSLGNKLYPNENPVLGANGERVPWPEEVESEAPTLSLPAGSGAIDIEKLVKYVSFFAERGYPILVVLNCGTTFKGAYDDVAEVTARLKPILEKNRLWQREVPADPNKPDGHKETRTGYWIHVDGALGASYVPFLKMAKASGNYDEVFEPYHGYDGPDFDFRNPMVHSVVTSGHKWPGAPWPTGVYMTKQQYMVSPPDNPEYIGSPDTTFAGSRNGLSPLVLWEYFARNSYKKQIDKAVEAQRTADYAYKALQEVAEYWQQRPDVSLPEGLWLQRTPLSLSLIFCQPNDDIIFRYSLAKEATNVNGSTRHYVHLFTMWDVTEELIDELCKDLKQDGAFNTDDFRELTEIETTRPRVENANKQFRLPVKGRSFR